MFRKLGYVFAGAPRVTVTIDDAGIEAEAGEPLAAVLLRTAPFSTRTSPVGGAPRAPYCMMGACFECLVKVDGICSTRSCLVQCRDGLVVRRHAGRPDPLQDAIA